MTKDKNLPFALSMQPDMSDLTAHDLDISTPLTPSPQAVERFHQLCALYLDKANQPETKEDVVEKHHGILVLHINDAYGRIAGEYRASEFFYVPKGLLQGEAMASGAVGHLQVQDGDGNGASQTYWVGVNTNENTIQITRKNQNGSWKTEGSISDIGIIFPQVLSDLCWDISEVINIDRDYLLSGMLGPELELDEPSQASDASCE